MKIRSITYFLNPGWPLDSQALRKAGAFIATARPAYEESGYEVQTSRLATLPFPRLVRNLDSEEAVKFAQSLEQATTSHGFDYVSIGPALPDTPESFAVIRDVLAGTEIVFTSGAMTTKDGGVSLPSVRASADIIRSIATLSPDGFANLRFAALANVPAGAPFFPAAYHDGAAPVFALATEAADLAVDAFTDATSLDAARQNLIATVERHAVRLTDVALNQARQHGLTFGGIDLTFAPFPTEALSIGTAIERLGVPKVGLHGSVAAVAILADTLDRAHFQRTGFNGVMLPVLEDSTLAASAAEGVLTVKDLLLYSVVCGTGLDTVPLPGDTSAEDLAAILLDLAVLAQRLDKPLTARLMPIPGKVVGDPTDFDFAYFANSRVLPVLAEPLHGLLRGDESFDLSPRKM